MPALDQAHANAILNASLDGGAATLSTAPLRLRFMTANGTATSNGTELATSGGYTAGAGAPTITFSAASAGSKTNSAQVSVAAMPATTLVGVEVWDSAGTPLRKWFSPLTASRTLNSGDTITFAVSSVVASLS